MSAMIGHTVFSQLYGMFQKRVFAWLQNGCPQGPLLQMATNMSSLTREDDLQFTVPKTALSIETYGFMHIKPTLQTLKVYSKRGI